MEAISEFFSGTGFALLFQGGNWKMLIMIAVACFLLYLAIVKKYEPLLLLPIAFGMLLANLPGAGLLDPPSEFNNNVGGLLYYLDYGVKLGIYPALIFLGVGAMTDFGPLIANPKSLILGAAAQIGIFLAFLLALALGFPAEAAASIGIIGGADGPTTIFTTSRLYPTLIGTITIAAYSYMALVPIVQPPVIRAITTKKERCIKMPYKPSSISHTTRILFPIIVTVVAGTIAPKSAELIGFLMFGNLIRECGVLKSLSDSAQNQLANLITLVLGISVAFKMRAELFVTTATLAIIGLGPVAVIFDTVGGVMFAKFINLFSKNKVNPMIGAAGISAFPMSSRVVHKMGLKEDPHNFLLMHAAGANVSGQIASVIAGGLIITLVEAIIG